MPLSHWHQWWQCPKIRKKILQIVLIYVTLKHMDEIKWKWAEYYLIYSTFKWHQKHNNMLASLTQYIFLQT